MMRWLRGLSCGQALVLVAIMWVATTGALVGALIAIAVR